MFVAEFCLGDKKGAGTEQHTVAERASEYAADSPCSPWPPVAPSAFSVTDSDVIVRLGFGEECCMVGWSSPCEVGLRGNESTT